MNQYLSDDEHRNPTTYDQTIDTLFNITLSLSPYVPFTIYYCYSLPAKTEAAWIEHYQKFASFKDFEYAFMQNLLGNILSFMDVYEKSA
mmetsp:Transcript_9366/g.14227  ORF Transcript_9366/g.14227 Transcript_9366/m.14227 type:complete len:89 (-) Transcript_9366:1010-1276(-)